MDRQIKFRVWDKVGRCMYYPWTTHIGSGGLRHEFSTSDGTKIGIDSLKVLMQFTGLHDKNGKEIWEGDVIKINKDILDQWPDGFGIKEVLVIEFINYGWFPFAYGVPCSSDIEVIGNVYENPELVGDGE